MRRRDLLGAAAALAAARFLTAGAAAARPGAAPAERDPFPLGVASGDPTADGVLLWTRVPDATGDLAVGYELAEDESFRRIVRRGRARAPAARGGAVHLEIAGLNPGRPYWYRFHLGGAVSRVGRTATAPLRPERLRLALTSCQHWEQGWFSAYADMIAQAPDAVLQVGDYIYEKSFGSGPNVRAFGTRDPVTLEEYRARYALYRSDPHLAAAHAELPFVVTWDDHEVENDYGGEIGVATVERSDFLRRRAAAYQAYFEHMPLRPSTLRADGEARLYRRLGYGDLATLHVLDTRQYRTPGACPSQERGGRVLGDCAAALAPDASMLGREQEAWLLSGLQAERARWSLIVQQTLFARLFLPQGPQARYSETWDGYAAGRDRIVAAIGAPPVRNAVVLGGDVHSFWVNDVGARDGHAGPVVATELVTTCLASHNGPASLFGPAPALNPHVRFLDNAHAGYALLDLSPTRLAADLRAVRDMRDPRSEAFSLARFAIEDGRPGALRA